MNLRSSALLLALAACSTGGQAGDTPASKTESLVRKPTVEVPKAVQTEVPSQDAPIQVPLYHVVESPLLLTGDPSLLFPLEVHEWGTFTSVQSSSGQDMEGLHHEEEPLPSFVHGRNGVCYSNMGKCLETILGGVTQKMETPVIYFHGKSNRPLTVKVDFPKGIISQWYPEADGFAPLVGSIDPSNLGGGSMTWKVALNPEGFSPPAVDPGDIWAPSRNVPSTPLRAWGEDENFIFYRGIGRFSLPFRTIADANGDVTVRNDDALDVPAAFAIRVDET